MGEIQGVNVLTILPTQVDTLGQGVEIADRRERSLLSSTRTRSVEDLS